MYFVMKQIGGRNSGKHRLVKKFRSIDKARKYVSEINNKTCFPAASAGRTGYYNRKQRMTNGLQKTLYNEASETTLFIQYKPEVVSLPMALTTTPNVTVDELLKVA